MNPLQPQNLASGAIASIANLSNTLGITESELKAVTKIPLSARYKKITIKKSNGDDRTVFDPCLQLRKIQRRINTRIFKKIVKWPSYLYGSIPNDKVPDDDHTDDEFHRDYVSCAKKHCRSKSILKLDITDFFENIHRELVSQLFKDFFHFDSEVVSFLTEVCCYDQRVVQGALTSSYIATLCFWDVEHKIVQKLQRRDLVYTRLVDDITISSKFKGYDFSNAESHVKNMLLEKDFPLNTEKRKVMRVGSGPFQVHGLIVDFSTPRLPPTEISKIKASVYNLVKSASVNNYRTTLTFRDQYFRCLGRVNRLARVNHNKHAPLLMKLKCIKPMPGNVDVEKVKNSIDLLRRAKDNSTALYRRLYYISRYRIALIARSFRHEADALLFDFNKLKKPLKTID